MIKSLPTLRRLTTCFLPGHDAGGRVSLSQGIQFQLAKSFSTQEDSSDSETRGKVSKPSTDADQDEPEQPKVVILGKGSAKIGTMKLDEAHHMAKKKNMKLIKLDQQERFNREVYRMLTETQLQQERAKAKTEEPTSKANKGEKTAEIRSKITSHDLEIKINSFKKWLAQRFLIRVTITNDAANSAERIYGEIEKAVVEAGGRILQKRNSGNDATLQFSIQCNNRKNPPKSEVTS